MSNQQSHSTISASEAEPPVFDSLPTDQNRRLLEGTDNTNHRTLKTVTRKKQSNNQDLENCSETSSAKRRIEEKMRDFENDLETKFETKFKLRNSKEHSLRERNLS